MDSGIIVSMYRQAGHHEAIPGIPTSYATHVLLVGEGIPGNVVHFEYQRHMAPQMPVFKLVRKTMSGKGHLHAEPIETTTKRRMFGGNFLYSSDSSSPSGYPIPVWDREE